ncbi:GNAT family N-acetyltransferase [Tessaracoccus coleopterorum]|uniref:GNAT family N-acetyltransferase n=1 Tax=Tessaracoccus coleopterorum TaxID=2714950 RepID=UPI001E5E5F86|nr:hypothetical protein [Tessaracoccus coleopterorum]
MTLIREARREDCQSILDLIRELATYEREPDAVVNTVEALEAHLFGAQPAVFCHVAEHEGRVIGLALWFLTYSTWEGATASTSTTSTSRPNTAARAPASPC